MLEAEGFEEILIDDIGPRADDGIHHVVADQVGEDLLQSGADERAGQAENDAAFLVAQHAVIDIGGAGQVAAGKSHPLHRVHHRNDVVVGNADMLDCFLEIILLLAHD